MTSVWAELEPRNVLKVAVAYAIVGWLLIQVAGTLLPAFEAPPWVFRVVVLLFRMGFMPRSRARADLRNHARGDQDHVLPARRPTPARGRPPPQLRDPGAGRGGRRVSDHRPICARANHRQASSSISPSRCGAGTPAALGSVLLVHVALLFVGVREFRETRNPMFFAYLAVITAGLITICWRKGEPLRWRWGGHGG